MSESPEIAGSMPSVPQPKPLQHMSPPGNSWVFVGLVLCAVSLLAFPKYAQTDNLGTGIFDGMGLLLLLFAIIVLSSLVSSLIPRRVSSE